MRTISATVLGQTTSVNIDKFPDECGICHKNISPNLITAIYIGVDRNSKYVEATFQCTNRECFSSIIGYYEVKSSGQYLLKRIAPNIPKELEFDTEISEISPTFVKIYNQALYAEQTGLTLISGIGYRKSLEFLIKDFLIHIDDDKKEIILTTPLGQCIDKLDNQNIKEIAKRATWLGNDEAHYSRKWEDKDVTDLKKLIGVTCHFISIDITTKRYLAEMS